MSDYDIVIVGFGPTGGTLANLLALSGISTCIIEREESLYNLPRAVHFDDEVMRVFQTIGIAKNLRKYLIINRGTRFIDKSGQILLDWPRPRKVTINGWNASYRFHQPDLERILRRRLRNKSSVEVFKNVELQNITEQGSNVKTTFKNLKDGTSTTVISKYVVGCDGARSLTRKLMNVSMESLGFRQTWIVIDMVMNSKERSLPDRTIQYCNLERPMTYCRNVGRRRRWEFAVLPEENPQDFLLPQAIWSYLERWISPTEANLERQASYTFKSEVAKTWRKGRLLLAGDSAHLMPPFMGQGMCAGIRDVSNLAWKLSFCVLNGHSEELLESYQSERYSNVIEYIKTSSYMGDFINTLGSLQVSNTVFKKKDGTAEMKSIEPELGFGLGNLRDPLRGKKFPNINLADGSSFDQYFAVRPIILTNIKIEKSETDFENLVICTKENPELDSILKKYAVNALLIRPDRYIMSSLPINRSNDETSFSYKKYDLLRFINSNQLR